MKTLLLAALFVTTVSIHAQVGTSPRTLTKRIAPQLPPQRPSATHPTPSGVAGTAGAASAGKAPETAADLEQKQMEQTAEAKKKLQWQTERAEKGSDPAQYALGMRYLEGKGVEKDLKKARKWLDASAKQGNAEAKKALADHPELPPAEKDSPAEPAKTP